MATIRNRWRDPRELLEALESPAASPLDITPLIVTPIVTDESLLGHLIENDQSLVAATGDPTLRPLADYLAGITVGGTSGEITSFETRATAVAATVSASTDAIGTSGYATAGDGGGARYYRVGGTTPGGFQSADGAWWAIEDGDINVRQFGAVGNGTGDDTAAVRDAVLALRQRTTIGVVQAEAAKIVFPSGVYKISGSINLQKLGDYIIGGSWTIDMRGAVILCTAAGKVLFDCLGSRYGKFLGGVIYGDPTLTPAVAFQQGRLTPPPGLIGFGGGHYYDHVTVSGHWTRACFYSLQGETNTFQHVTGHNSRVGSGSSLILDGLYHYSLITDFDVPTQTPDTALSFIQNTFVDCEFTAQQTPAIDILGALQVRFYNCYSACLGNNIRLRSVGDIGYFLADIHLDIHCEANAGFSNIEIERLGAAGTFTLDGFSHNDVVTQATVSYIKTTNITQLSLFDSKIETHNTTVPLFSGSATVRYGGTVKGNPVGWIEGVDGITSLTCDFTSLGRRGAINQVFLNVPLTAPGSLILPPANEVPKGWTLFFADIVGGITPTNTLTVTRRGTTSDTIEAGTQMVVASTYAAFSLVSDGVSKWTVGSAKVDVYGTPYATFTSTPTAGSGTFTSATAAGRWKRAGKTIFIEVVVTITTNGTAATYVNVPLPTTNNTIADYYLSGRATVSGKTLNGHCLASNLNLQIRNYDGTYPGASGETLTVSGFYEIT